MAPGDPPRRSADLGLGEDEARSWRPFRRRSPAGRKLVGLQGSPRTPRGLGPLWIQTIDGRPCPQLLPGFEPDPEPALIEAKTLRGPLLFIELVPGALSLLVPLRLPDGGVEALPIGGAAARVLRQGGLGQAVALGWSLVLAGDGEALRIIAGLREGRRASWPSLSAALGRTAPLARVLDRRPGGDATALFLWAEGWRERAGAVIAHLPRAPGAPYWRFGQNDRAATPPEDRFFGAQPGGEARSKARPEKGR